MITKGRYQTKKTKSSVPPFKYQIIDTDEKNLGNRFVCCTDTEKKADTVAGALNFNDKPHAYGYKLVD